MKRSLTLAAAIAAHTCLLLAAAGSSAGELGFQEDFALAEDRTKVLEQLIPGTRDYYYYHCLHLQNNQKYEQVDKLLQTWIKRHGRTARTKEIRYRQALLTYELNPQASLKFIRQELKLQFNHQRARYGAKSELPSQLDPNLISRETLANTAFQDYRDLNRFTDSALEWLLEQTLNERRQTVLLQRLKRPDHKNVVKLVAADLERHQPGRFGSLKLHRQLTLDQLDQLLFFAPLTDKKYDLRNQSNFVNTYLTKLRPADDVDWQHNAKHREAYFDRLWEFVSDLAPAHNSLKASVLYHRLVHDRALGVYNKQRFLTYIQLPRNAAYIEPRFMRLRDSQRSRANLSQNFHAQTLLQPIGNDEPLVRSYLHHFFVTENSIAPYSQWIADSYLNRQFAETKIVNGLGDAEKLYSMLPPAEYQKLKERIDLDFVSTNRTHFGPNDPVALDLDVKNVRSLIVKVFEINTTNYYRKSLREITTDIGLDGLVANHEQTYQYDEPALRRVRRHFEFPQCQGRGVYIIDFIGNGKSSRALIHKGRLRFLTRTTVAGQVFTVLDEANRHLKDATLWLAGQEYRPDERGQITVPFSNHPKRQKIVLSADGFSTLQHFQHEAEAYRFQAGIYIDRGSLLARKKADIVVRPSLLINNIPTTLKLLEEVTLTIKSTDLDGVSSIKTINDFKLYEDREATYEFTTPKRLVRLDINLKAKVKNLSQNTKVDLTAKQFFMLNVIDTEQFTQDLHFANLAGNYVIDVLGKTGEPRAHHPVALQFHHRDFTQPVQITLQSDETGRIHLGPLTDITQVRATDRSKTWPLRNDARTHYQSVHGRVGETISIPLLDADNELSRRDVSLLELRSDTFVADRFDNVTLKDGSLQITGLPRGDYSLLLKRSGTHVRVRVSAGQTAHGHVLSGNRQLELRGRESVQIGDIDVADDKITVALHNAGKFSRVHVFASRYRPAYPAFGILSQVRDAEPAIVTTAKAESFYVAGRNIGDEYRYIIDRRYAKKFPGNMLERPSLLLNPWAIRTTDTGRQDPNAGAEFERRGGVSRGFAVRKGGGSAGSESTADTANLDFLADTSTVLINIVPDEQGQVTIDRDLLASNQHVHIIACDPTSTVSRHVSLPEVRVPPRDLRLLVGLDPAQHFAQQKQISYVGPQSEFVISDITTSRLEAYDNLSSVYGLYSTLSGDAKLREFNFILRWHTLKPAEKQALFSKYACHELAFFIAQKDGEFFTQTVKPYLANKRDKTFLDHWLLGNDLTEYLEPWNHAQLNIVERILLGQRLADEQARAARHISDLFDLNPPDVNRFNHLFNTAVQGSALNTSSVFNYQKAQRDAIANLSQATERRQQLEQAFRMQTSPPTDKSAQSGAARSNTPLAALAPRPSSLPPAAAAEPEEGAAFEEEADEEPFADDDYDAADGITASALRDFRREAARTARLSEKKKEVAKRLSERMKDRGEGGYFDANELASRKQVRQLYRQLPKTQEWVENNYYKLSIIDQNSHLIRTNAFWNDFAAHDREQPFHSTHLAEASRNFTEMMFALSVLDLPTESPEHKTQFDKQSMKIDAAGPIVAFHEEIRPVADDVKNQTILVSQNFFRLDDRYRTQGNQRHDKYVTEEFLTDVVYGCKIVITNTTSLPQQLNVLQQLPIGAIPVMSAHKTRNIPLQLNAYSTGTFEYHFYFPTVGKFPHYPVHAAQNERLVAYAEPFTFNVVKELSKIDRESWIYISQQGSNEDVLAYLKANNLHRTSLARIAFRMRDKAFFQQVIDLLTKRHIYDWVLWSYGIHHDEPAVIREFLQHHRQFASRCGTVIDSPLLTIDPVVRKLYEHTEYRPLVNARAHALGKRREIVNQRQLAQYNRLLKILSYRRSLTDDDQMAAAYYLYLQDRIEEGIHFFRQVDVNALATRMQYDYADAYTAMYLEDTARARAIAKRYADHPVDRWRNTFAAVTAQLDEIDGAATEVIDDEKQAQQQTKLAATEPSFDFTVEAKQVTLNYQNVKQVTVNYYLMDIELLFSRNPFVQQVSGKFSYISPNQTVTVELPTDKNRHTFSLPETMHNRNVLVEITAAGQNKQQTYFSNSLNLQTIENYGQVRVTHAVTGRPVPKTYVKVYALRGDGSVRFYKDGYTDLRGRFDYASLSTNDLNTVQKFSLLVLSDEHGAVVREAMPPSR